MISLCSGVWPRRYFAAGGRQDHAEQDLRDRLQSACGLQVSKATTCRTGCHKFNRKCRIVSGGEECSLNLNYAICRFCAMYRGDIPVSVSSAVGCP